MFGFFANCIFCNARLPDVPSGDGEHVFPDSIFGFWRSYDVCSDCRQSFGHDIDRLAIQDVSILNAMEFLKLKDTSPHLDNLPWTGQDTIDKREVPMVRRGDSFRVKVTKRDDFLECSEQDLDNISKPWLKELTRGKLTDHEFEKHYAEFRHAYLGLAPGETYHSLAFGFSIRRRQTSNIRVQEPTPLAITRLIAKIVTCFIHYTFPRDQLAHIEELQMLREHARFGAQLKPLSINPLRPLEDGKYFPFHRIVAYPDKRITMIDTTFFGNIAWRAVIHSTEPLIIKDDSGRQAEDFLFVLDFSDLLDRHKHIGFKYLDEETISWHEIDAQP